MGWSSPGRLALLVATLGGCAAIAGIGDPSQSDEADQGIGAPPRSEGASSDGAPEPLDAGGPCTPERAPAPDGKVHAMAAAGDIRVDGLFDDWACVPRVDVAKGAFSKGIDDAATFEIAAQWSGTHLYLYARATTTEPGLDFTGSQIFRNDSLHFFLGPLPRAGTYRATDHQIVFDHDGRKALYRNGLSVTSELDAAVARRVLGSELTIEVELRLPAEMLGVSSFARGDAFFLNAQLNDAKDSGFGFRVFHLPAACGCTTGCCETAGTTNLPYCDTRCTGELLLE